MRGEGGRRIDKKMGGNVCRKKEIKADPTLSFLAKMNSGKREGGRGGFEKKEDVKYEQKKGTLPNPADQGGPNRCWTQGDFLK